MRKIKLNNSSYTCVDDEDYDRILSVGKWGCTEKVTSSTSSKKYACTNLKTESTKKRKQILMHRMIMNASPSQYVLHNDLDTLNNCKSNLEIVERGKCNKKERRGKNTKAWAKIKHHPFRDKIALYLSVWRKNQSIRKTASILGSHHGYVGRVLNHSSMYLKIKNKFRGQYSQGDNIYASQWAKKLKAIELLGGKCKKCGNKNPIQLDFHHRGEEKKEANLSHMFGDSRKWDEIKEESLKCILLCRNCHATKHTDAKKIKRLKYLINNIKRFRL